MITVREATVTAPPRTGKANNSWSRLRVFLTRCCPAAPTVLSVARRSVSVWYASAHSSSRRPLWRYPGADGWHFVSLPAEISTDITDITTGIRRGFGSVRVAVTVGSTSWRTSIFPDNKTGAYLLPVKKAVRVAERLAVSDQVKAQLQIADL